jgi:hypothetical protein
MTSPMHGSDLFARIRVKPAWQSLPARTRRNPILCPRKKAFINEKKWEEMRRHGDSEKNDCSQCRLFINDSLLWFIHVETSVEFLKGTMLYSCAIFFDSFSAMCFMVIFWHSLLPSHRNASHRFSLVRMMLIPRTSDNARTAVKFKTLQDVEQSC